MGKCNIGDRIDTLASFIVAGGIVIFVPECTVIVDIVAVIILDKDMIVDKFQIFTAAGGDGMHTLAHGDPFGAELISFDLCGCCIGAHHTAIASGDIDLCHVVVQAIVVGALGGSCLEEVIAAGDVHDAVGILGVGQIIDKCTAVFGVGGFCRQAAAGEGHLTAGHTAADITLHAHVAVGDGQGRCVAAAITVTVGVAVAAIAIEGYGTAGDIQIAGGVNGNRSVIDFRIRIEPFLIIFCVDRDSTAGNIHLAAVDVQAASDVGVIDGQVTTRDVQLCPSTDITEGPQ